MIEKLEQCPVCREHLGQADYDFQRHLDHWVAASPLVRSQKPRHAEQLWDVLLKIAYHHGHRCDPGESEFDFLQRLVARKP